MSTADNPALPLDAVEVGRVLGAWGVKGGIKVKPFAADPQALFSTKRWYLQPPDPPQGQRAGQPVESGKRGAVVEHRRHPHDHGQRQMAAGHHLAGCT